MSAQKMLDLTACAREPIHFPGSIQPHGLLLVVDSESDLVLQAAGDVASLLGSKGPVLGRTLQALLGFSLAALIQRADTKLLREPTYLGTASPRGASGELIVTAHLVAEAVVVEVSPSIRPASAAETLASIRSITERIGGSAGLIEACQLAAVEVRRIIGYDRVMIYQFLPDGSGSVIAEVKDDSLAPLLNHRYPASDIPTQARELYRRNPIRLIPDVGYIPVPIAPTITPTTNQPLDMSHCVLRSVSPVHIRYLKNMNVGASLSVSLLPRGELWGLIACHNTTPRLVSYEAHEACRHVGQILSQQVRARQESDGHRVGRELGAARDKAMRALIGADDPGALLLQANPDLQAIVPSHGIAVTRKGNIAIAGRTPTEAQVRKLVAWLEERISGNGLFVSDCLVNEYPEANDFTSEACGVLAIVLPDEEPVVVTWFRMEQVEEINWAGNPHEPVDPSSHLGELNPRKSFATWRETVKGRSRPWEMVDLDSVQGFGARASFVLQQKRVRELNNLLERANAQLATLAAADGLTGLANRRAFDERLNKEWLRASRPPRRSLSMIMLDLDFFKQYNDYFGHVMGDECLKQVADVLQKGRRTPDLAARIGGEEFCLLLPETDAKGAMSLAETVRTRIESLQLPHPKSHLGVVTASLGVAVADPSGGVQGFMWAADKALYEAKESGRNRVVGAHSDGDPARIGSESRLIEQ